MSDFGDMIVALLAFIAMVLFIALCLGAPVMLLWNAVIPTIFGLTKLPFGKLLLLIFLLLCFLVELK